MCNRGLHYDSFIHAHVCFSHMHPLSFSLVLLILTDPLTHARPLSCLSYDQMDFMKAALTSKVRICLQEPRYLIMQQKKMSLLHQPLAAIEFSGRAGPHESRPTP